MTLIKSASTSTSTSTSIPQTVADNPQKQLPLPVGKNSPIPRAASSTARQSLPKAPVETGPAGPTENRQALDRMISENREAPASKGAFRLTSKHLGSAKRAEAQEYHQRMETKAPVFFNEFGTEKPALSGLRPYTRASATITPYGTWASAGGTCTPTRRSRVTIAGSAHKKPARSSVPRAAAPELSAALLRRPPSTRLAANTLLDYTSMLSTCWAAKRVSCIW
ncbi:hypothetical protein ACEQUB_00809 [Ralstonia syzygii]